MISVIIPTYKNRGGLSKCIDSALSQVCDTKIEVIVVDDNVPNSLERRNTEKLMKDYALEERVIYIQHQNNKNGAAARNTGIRESKGEYIAFLDDDDRFLPGKLQKQKQYLDEHLEYGAVYCLAQRNGRLYGNDRSFGDCTRELLMLQTCIYTPCQMFRRTAIETIAGYDETFKRHQDYDVLLRFFHAGYKIGCIPEVLTEIGTNAGENILSGKKMEENKKYFFQKFMPYIVEIDKNEPGFKNRVLAKHYACVCLNHLKHHQLKMAVSTFLKYAKKSPHVFSQTIIDNIATHLNVKQNVKH